MCKLGCLKAACAAFVVCLIAAIHLPAQTFTTLHSFDFTDGYEPQGALLQATDGNLYGATLSGGTSSACYSGCGTVFRITPGGVLTTLYTFCELANGADGLNPSGGLIEGADGSFYGTTAGGGTIGQGTVFKITSAGVLTTLYNFCSVASCSDGASPLAPLIIGSDGSFYGTTYAGGTANSGTVFGITRSGSLTTLWSFCLQNNCTDGSRPTAGVIQARDGSLYGTTGNGGADNEGIFFKLLTSGGGFTVLYSFSNGNNPFSGVVQARDGNFYGTASSGGLQNQGSVFKITTSGVFITLHSFCSVSDCPDGALPEAALIQATDHDLYGTTIFGGNPFSFGTIFRVTPSGGFVTVHYFCSDGGCSDGAEPSAPLVQDTNGDLYGTTVIGGAKNYGTIFRFALGLPRFVKTEPASGAVGGPVRILGTDLTDATSVTFNGTPATFAVVSPSLITTTVPAGATSGTVQVVTPDGTLSSNVPFRVLP